MTSLEENIRLRCKDFIESQLQEADMDALKRNDKKSVLEKFK